MNQGTQGYSLMKKTEGRKSQYGATTEAAESLMAEIISQSKLARPRRENRKIRYEN
jgi:hypothetical protein